MGYSFGNFMNTITTGPISIINAVGGNMNSVINTASGSFSHALGSLGGAVSSISSSLTVPLMIGAAAIVLVLVLNK